MKQKTLVRTLAALTAAAALVLSGCGKSADQAPAESKTETAQEASDASEETAAETEDADAAASAEEEPKEQKPLEVVEYSVMIDKNENSYFYENYSDNPIYKYWSSMEWDPDGDGSRKQISITFTAPTEGAEKDYVNTIMATQEYPDMMAMNYATTTASALVEEGVALDITDAVEKYMPNYMKWLDENPEYARMITQNVDGKRHIYQLYCVGDMPQKLWCGWEYRRDWLVKYGKNPKTGEAFTGAWEGEEWVDDVVFPSGNTDPIYISDWEWMLPILQEALEKEGITDGYAMQICSPGYYQTGELVTGFNTSGAYYLNKDGECVYGPTEENFRAYLECMHHWYEEGWIDPFFEEHVEDRLFWKVDTPTVFSGKVGCFFGMNSQTGKGMEGAGDYTDGIVIFGASQPINDVYGDKDAQGADPATYFSNSVISQSFIITNKAADKDLGPLLTALDYLYGDEGGRLRTRGFSDEMQAEIQDEFYNEQGLQEGAYHLEDRDGEEWVVVNPVLTEVEGLTTAGRMLRLPGLGIEKNFDELQNPVLTHAVDQWRRYVNTGTIIAAISGQLTPDQTEEYGLINNNVNTYLSQEVPNFITGRRELSDAEWEKYLNDLAAFSPDTYCEYINAVLN